MRRNLIFSMAITVVFLLSCNAQKSVDPTGKTPLPVGRDRTVDPDTSAASDTTLVRPENSD